MNEHEHAPRKTIVKNVVEFCACGYWRYEAEIAKQLGRLGKRDMSGWQAPESSSEK